MLIERDTFRRQYNNTSFLLKSLQFFNYLSEIARLQRKVPREMARTGRQCAKNHRDLSSTKLHEMNTSINLYYRSEAFLCITLPISRHRRFLRNALSQKTIAGHSWCTSNGCSSKTLCCHTSSNTTRPKFKNWERSERYKFVFILSYLVTQKLLLNHGII